MFATSDKPIAACDIASTTVSPDFRNFVTTADSSYVSGLWTVLGTWTVQADATVVNGYGVRVGSQGAALLYQDDTKRGDMQVAITMTPEKTSGAGFGSRGSPSDGPTVQKSDIFIKYDPRTQTGYSLRYWRTTQSASACLFQLFRIDNGVGTPLNDTQVLTGVFRPNTGMKVDRRSAHRGRPQQLQRRDALSGGNDHAERLRRRRRRLGRHGVARQQQHVQQARDQLPGRDGARVSDPATAAPSTRAPTSSWPTWA